MRTVFSLIFLITVNALIAAHTDQPKFGAATTPLYLLDPVGASLQSRPGRNLLAPGETSYKYKIGFELNKNQWPEQVKYKADLGGGRTVFFENNKFTYVVYDPDELYRHHGEAHSNKGSDENAVIHAHAFEMNFLNSLEAVNVAGSDPESFRYNYFIGNDPEKWASDVPVFRTVTYKNLYSGIDLLAYAHKDEFKYDYVIAPGANPKKIQVQFNGINSLSLKEGNLCITTSVGEILESIPYSYQLINGAEIAVKCKYLLSGDGKTVSFYLPEGYNKDYALIIDPVLVAATYSGSNANTYGHCSTFDAAGNIYSGGRCFGTGYPAGVGAFQTTFGGGVDIAISKLNPTGTSLIYATYLGGNNQDFPHSLFVDTNNQLFVFGSSTSTNYPTSSGCFDNSNNGVSDIIISKLNPSGSTLLGSTYVGGNANDGINVAAAYNYGDTYRGEVIVDAQGDPFFVSTTASSDFPVTAGAYDGSYNGGQDAVVFKMNANLTAMSWATFLGGTMIDAGCSIRVNSNGEVYVVGLTQGSGFPTSSGALHTTYMGSSYDGFVSRFSSTGASLINSTFIGTNFRDITYLVDLDLYNNVYIYGISEGSIPTTPGVYSNPNSQNYLTKLDPSLSTVMYSTVLGNGSHGLFSPTALMVDLCQNVYLSGWGNSAFYPLTSNATQTTGTNGFHLLVLSQNASTLLYGSHFGLNGDHVDGGTSRFDPNGIIYQGVCCCSTGYPTFPGAYAPTKGPGSCDIVVFKINFQINCNPLITNALICYGNTATINIVNVNNLLNPTYSIQPGGLVSSIPVFTVSPGATATYTIFITGTNSFNALVTNTGLATVTVAPLPQTIPSLTQAICGNTLTAFNLGLTFLPATPVPTYAVFWSPVPNGVLNNTQTSVASGVAPGFYQATITAAHGCTTSTSFSINPIPTAVSFSVLGPFEVTCNTPTVTVSLVPASYNYTWTGLTATYSGSSASFTVGNTGNWLVIANDPLSGCTGTQSFVITQNISTATSTVAPLLQNITCSITSIITVSASGSSSVNVMHYWLSPLGGTLISIGALSTYTPGFPGTYTHVMVNITNGCSVTKTFTVTSGSGFPTFSVSSPQNFTLGCYTRSVATINISNAQTTPIPGGSVSYTILGPSSMLPYTPSVNSTFTNITEPGTYTVITKDNSNFCETRVFISVLQNTFAPAIAAIVPRQILTCDYPSTLLQGISTNTWVSYNWSFPGVPGNLPSDTIRIHTTASGTNSVIANYTLSVTDNNNTCRSTTVVPMLQNLYPPNANFSGNLPISCYTPTITLTNISNSTIPPALFLNLPVIALVWMGPSPQQPQQLSSTYVGSIPGTYTMVAKDLNNGCLSVATRSVDDFRDYPIVNSPQAPEPFIFDCAANGATIYPTISSPTANLSYQWLAVPNTSFSTLSERSTIVNNIGQFYITVTNTLNGCATSGVLEVNLGNLKANFNVEPSSGFAPLHVKFTNLSSSSSTVNGTQGILSHWSFGNGTVLAGVMASVNPETNYTQGGTYKVVLFVNKGACSDTTVRLIHVEIPSMIEIPNVFSPNNDGTNDVFFLKGSNLVDLTALIIDRWGRKVYELTSGTGNISWDGKDQLGKEVAEGVYMYVITATGSDGRPYDQRGTITLVR
ncbi:MAG: gliding motility-associated C-terminal domain-containing protein [bacterium]|nr:gliding motility-associated C-terminal domain-containing protein [bacterium]